MLLTRKRNRPIHPNLIMENTILKEVVIHKHLGLIFSQNCGWQAHIEDIVKKAWQRINIIRAFKFKLDRASLERMYISFVRPVLEYGGPIWDNCSTEDKSKIESVQIEAMRIVTGATKLCSIAKLYDDTGWETLQRRRYKQKLLIFYKMVHGLVPSQFVLKSTRTQVNPYSFWSIRTQNFCQFVLIWSIRTHVWSIRTHFGRFVLILVNSYSYSNEYESTRMSTN